MKKRLSAMVLDESKFWQISLQSQGLSNDECPWICNISIGHNLVRDGSQLLLLHIQA